MEPERAQHRAHHEGTEALVGRDRRERRHDVAAVLGGAGQRSAGTTEVGRGGLADTDEQHQAWPLGSPVGRVSGGATGDRDRGQLAGATGGPRRLERGEEIDAEGVTGLVGFLAQIVTGMQGRLEPLYAWYRTFDATGTPPVVGANSLPSARFAAPIFAALGRWAVRSPKHDATRPFSPVSLMLSFRTMLNEAVAGDFAARVALRIGGEDLHWVREDGQVTVGRGEIERPDLRFVAASASDIAAAVYGDAPFESVLAEGDLRLAQRFRSLFTLPPKVEAAAALS